ncbi:MAG TPA: hypothetical protein VGY54_03980 [Polyangiaceae bacterium]|jgi:hypothetical protein|nr:hypothetical protein [Polyangiaceae bacterium]
MKRNEREAAEAQVARIVQTIAMLTDALVGEVTHPHGSNGACDGTEDQCQRVRIALQAAGWALQTLGEVRDGESLQQACSRLIDRHNCGAHVHTSANDTRGRS